MSVRERVFAALYDPLGAHWEKTHGAALRRKLLAEVRGRVLEIGVGTGQNFPHYPAVDELVGVEPSEPMLRRARQRAAEAGRKVTLVEAPAEQLPFEDESFDTVVTMAVLCTVDDPEESLREVRRVLRSGGRYRFSEHVRSSDPKLARWQDRLNGLNTRIGHGCNCNRPTLATVGGAGFAIGDVTHERFPKAPPHVRPLVVGAAARV